jgi:hypothetical protein
LHSIGGVYLKKVRLVGVIPFGLALFYPMKAAGYTISQLVGYTHTPVKKMTFGSGRRITNGFGRKKEFIHSFIETTHRTGFTYWVKKMEKLSSTTTPLIREFN